MVFCWVGWSCEINYPEIKEVDYKVNYYFTENRLDYSMSFDFAIKVLKSKDVFKLSIENKNTREFIQVINSNHSSFFIDSILGKDILYCRDLRFIFFDETFEDFTSCIRLFDKGMRVYSRELVISLGMSKYDLDDVPNYVYKFKDMAMLNKLTNSKVFFVKTFKDKVYSVSSVVRIDSIDALEVDKTLDNYISFYYVEKNSNLFFKVNLKDQIGPTRT
ncbi:lipoprotein, putative [Borreliella bavariensis PBi]|uniref:Lipoprotein, putative n=1 Tax=Borrelia garinii subsp. bavariensis (strain ATCC BAA-2496 / DSM 23469 / PBi) TaxID=290434 RepID=A0A7I6GVR1_BORGP|nr:lipoprotein, putative [Borreliella bavariensis PBi]